MAKKVTGEMSKALVPVRTGALVRIESGEKAPKRIVQGGPFVMAVPADPAESIKTLLLYKKLVRAFGPARLAAWAKTLEENQYVVNQWAIPGEGEQLSPAEALYLVVEQADSKVRRALASYWRKATGWAVLSADLVMYPAAAAVCSYKGETTNHLVPGLCCLALTASVGESTLRVFPKFVSHPFHQYGYHIGGGDGSSGEE